MFTSVQLRTAFLSITVLAAGCGAADQGEELSPAELGSVAKADSTVTLPAPGDTAGRLYFDNPVWGYLSDPGAGTTRSDLDYRVFTAKGKHEFKVGTAAMAADQQTIDTSKSVGIKLHRLARQHGRLTWLVVASADGANGVATIRYSGAADRTYLLESTGSPLPLSIKTTLVCAGGDHSACALAGQPGDKCGGLAASLFTCDDGLYCQYASGTCGAGDQQGTCTVPARICPLFYSPVCGCDGKTYGNACEVTGGRTSVDHAGACACKFADTNIDGDTLAEMPWTNQTQTYFYTFTGNGTAVNNSGTFQLRIEPPCLRSTPHCEIAIQERNGSFYTYGSTLELDYDNGDVAYFNAQLDCHNSWQLVGNDFNQDMTLTVTTITP